MPGFAGFLVFLTILAVADGGVRRWGSPAARRKPRRGGRVTVLFVGVCTTCIGLEFLGAQVWPRSHVLSVAVLLLQYPGATAVALGLDRAMPQPGHDDPFG